LLFLVFSVAYNDDYLVIDGGCLRIAGSLYMYKLLQSSSFRLDFVVTYAILLVVTFFPSQCRHFRVTDEAEIVAVDEDQLGEFRDSRAIITPLVAMIARA